MSQVFAVNAKKKATNLSLNGKLLAEEKCLKINLSATMGKTLAEEVRKMEGAAMVVR